MHAGKNTLGNRTKVVIVEFLTLGRGGAEERPARVDEVGTGIEKVAVDQKVLLLRAGC